MQDPYKSTQKVYDTLGEEYLVSIEKASPKELDFFIKTFPKKSKVLDVGCAGGRDSEAFLKAGFITTGIDSSKVFIKIVKRRLPKGRFLVMDVRKLKFPASYFHGIWASAILLHLKKQDLPKVLKSFYRILKPDGVLNLRVKLGRGEKMVKEKLVKGKYRYYSFFQKIEMEKYLKDAGFKIIDSHISKDALSRKNLNWLGVVVRKSL